MRFLLAAALAAPLLLAPYAAAPTPHVPTPHVPTPHVVHVPTPHVRTVQSVAEPWTPAAGYGWPLAGRPEVLRPFEAPAHRYGPGHRGVDLRGSPGQPVLAASDGTVAFTGMVAGRPVVSVDHPNGLRTTYEPVTPAVAAGTRVRRGEVLGILQPGHAGCPADACLHWGVRRGEHYLDPLALLGLGRVRLLPLGS